MLSFLPAHVKRVLSSLLLLINTVALCTPLFVISLFKVIIPVAFWQRLCSGLLIIIAETWISINNLIIDLFCKTEIEIEGLDGLQKRGWYMVVANHQSWVDIPILQRTFNHKIPFLKFFLKQELIWVPVLGMAWWALDFPFMKRYSREYLQKNPHMKGKDLETTRKACAKFKTTPVSVMNFLEGTRYTESKYEAQLERYPDNPRYRHLLQPKSGGLAFVLSAMGEQFTALVDVTLVYPDGRPSFAQLLAGEVRRVKVIIRQKPIPEDVLQGDYENDPLFRQYFQEWVNSLWLEKDALIEQHQG